MISILNRPPRFRAVIAGLAAAASAVAIVVPLGAVALEASEKRECFRDWTEASRIVARENLIGVKELSAAAKSQADARVVRTVLCRDGKAYVYRVVLRTQTGRLSTRTIDAAKSVAGRSKRDFGKQNAAN